MSNYYIARKIEKPVDEYLKSFAAVGITGPRQSGKTTLLKNHLSHYRYVSMDDYRNAEFFNSDPEGFFAKYDDRVIFDEVHFTPKIFNHIKTAIDNDRHNYGKYILSSSSQFVYLKHVTESLAGRIGLLSLLPLELAEYPSSFSDEFIVRGSYPELITNPAINRNHWYSSYIDTYLNKDVRQIANIGDMSSFQKLIQLLAASTSSILDMSNLAKKIGVSSPTIKSWISILEASYIIFLLRPYYNNYGKRITKSPKIYFYDTGLVSYLTGIENSSMYNLGPMSGAIFENYVISEIIKKHTHQKSYSNFYYLNTNNGEEIDLIIDNKTSKQLIEIKKTATFNPAHIKQIKKFLDPKTDKGFVLYNGVFMEYSNDITICNFVDYLKM